MEPIGERSFDAGPVTEYKNPSGPRVFAAYLNHDDWRERFVASLLRSPLSIVWSSAWASDWESDIAGEARSTTLLTTETKPLLLADLAFCDDGVGRRYEIAAVLPGEELPDVTIRRTMDPFVRIFLMEGKGLEWLIHQPNDSQDYIFVNRAPSPATVDLLGREWGLFEPAKVVGAWPHWGWVADSQRDGTLPP